jgi:uncharacterized membrane protein
MYAYLSQSAALAFESTSQGFEIATVVFVGMILALVYTFVVMLRGAQGHPPRKRPAWAEFAIPLLSVIGLAVASYLAYIEVTSTKAVCGPVGDCNAVNTSSYARLFGVLPIGVMGMGGYIAILAAWLWGRLRSDKLADNAPALLFGMALFGTLFSIYLTYLELHVITAVCMWCVSSAVTMTIVMLLSIYPVRLKMAEALEESVELPPASPKQSQKTSKSQTGKRKGRKR